MASAPGVLSRLSVLRNSSRLTGRVSRPGRTVTPARAAVCSPSGAVLPKPRKVSALSVQMFGGAAVKAQRSADV